MKKYIWSARSNNRLNQLLDMFECLKSKDGDMLYRIPHYTKIFLLNPTIFFKKVLARIFLKIIPSPKGVVQVNIGGHTIDTLPSRNNWWKAMYLGYCGVEITHNIKRYLTTGGVFVDVGAGIGYYSAIASEIVGASGEVHCFEPYPPNVKGIRRMIKGNPNSNIILNSYALGVDDSVHNFYIKIHANRTEVSMVGNIIKKEVNEMIEVRTRRLDNYLEEMKLDDITLIKIDVEGYEYFVLKGLRGFFQRTTHKPAIICEIFAPAYKKSDLSLGALRLYMRDYGYQAYNIFNPRKRVDIRFLRETTDVIFMPVRQPTV